MGMVLDVGICSDVGDKRKTNEDSILVKTCFVKEQEIGLFVVADGMGGLSAGKAASALAVSVLSNWWDDHFLNMIVEKKTISEMLESLDNVIKLINYQLNRRAERQGSTLSLLLLMGDLYIIRNIGDSRIYVINKKITQLTQDESYAEEMFRRGLIKKGDPLFYSKKNLVTNCLGVNPKLKIQGSTGKINEGDTFLLATDGYYNHTNDPDILKVIFNTAIFTMQDKVTEMRSLIKKGEALDNVSLILTKPVKT